MTGGKRILKQSRGYERSKVLKKKEVDASRTSTNGKEHQGTYPKKRRAP